MIKSSSDSAGLYGIEARLLDEASSARKDPLRIILLLISYDARTNLLRITQQSALVQTATGIVASLAINAGAFLANDGLSGIGIAALFEVTFGIALAINQAKTVGHVVIVSGVAITMIWFIICAFTLGLSGPIGQPAVSSEHAGIGQAYFLKYRDR